VDEFLSFNEFRLDLRRIIVDEMTGWSLWVTAGAFALTMLLDGLRRMNAPADRKRIVDEAATKAVTSLAVAASAVSCRAAPSPENPTMDEHGPAKPDGKCQQ